MALYAKELPTDRLGRAMTSEVPAEPAQTRYISENGSASSVITVSSVTTSIEIAPVGAAAVMRWVKQGDTTASVVSAVSGANFDHVIPSGTYRRFVIPIETNPQNDTSGSVKGINIAQGLYQRFAVMTVATASVLTAEFN